MTSAAGPAAGVPGQHAGRAAVVTALTVDGDANTGGDPFDAEQALRYTTSWPSA
jgi:hypothetical protein